MPREADFPESLPTVPLDLQHLDAKPSHYDRLKKEAEGLFAGVTLLNEMEPLEDRDKSPSAIDRLDDTINSINTRSFKRCLYQLQLDPLEKVSIARFVL
jgi:hypothetical protein